MSKKASFYALLIGINEYAHPPIRRLEGSVNDVEAIEQLLMEHFAVPQGHIRTLTNAQATHEAIKRTFREHLIGHAKMWEAAGGSQPPPAFLFHYSGHGAQMPDSTESEPDGYHETIVPYDSRTPGVFDIPDWELRELLDELGSYSDNITVILDCCHSGSGIRFSGEAPRIARIRQWVMDERPQPSSPQEHIPDNKRTMIRILEDEDHVLLAACSNRQLAYEYTSDGKTHGALTYFLVQELSRMTSTGWLTYQELHRRVRYELMRVYPQQTPQCEGAIERDVFERRVPQQDHFFDVIEVGAGVIWINGGAVHGLRKGTILNVYPPETRSLAHAGPSLGKLVLDEVGVAYSRCSPLEGQPSFALHARAIIYVLSEDESFPRPRIVLDMEDEGLREAARSLLIDREVAAYIDVVDSPAGADFRLQALGDASPSSGESKLEIQNRVGERLVAPYSQQELDDVARDLERMVRYQNALRLHNPAPNAALAGKIEVTIKKLAFDANKKPYAIALPTTAEGNLIVKTGQKVVFELTNHSHKALYIALLEFDTDWSIDLYYPPRGANEALKAGRSVYHGLSNNPKKQFQVKPLPPEVKEKTITLKAFATTEETHFEILTQRGLKTRSQTGTSRSDHPRRPRSALDEILEQAMRGQKTRLSSPSDQNKIKDPSHEWTTTQIQVVIRRGDSG
ncbi:MAG: caspase family protein [Ardenticatenaceae bacterium]